MRRVLGVLSMLLLFHLSLATGDFACAPHAKHIGRAGHAHMNHAGMQMSEPRAPHSNAAPTARGESHENCPTPTTPACCTAMASCGTVYMARGATNELQLVPTTDRARADLLMAGAHATGPETPPPRA